MNKIVALSEFILVILFLSSCSSTLNYYYPSTNHLSNFDFPIYFGKINTNNQNCIPHNGYIYEERKESITGTGNYDQTRNEIKGTVSFFKATKFEGDLNKLIKKLYSQNSKIYVDRITLGRIKQLFYGQAFGTSDYNARYLIAKIVSCSNNNGETKK